MYRAADHIEAKTTNYPVPGGNLVCRWEPTGLRSVNLETLLVNRNIYRGGEERIDATECRANGDLFFCLRKHDIGHVDGRAIECTQDWDEAVDLAEQASTDSADVTIHAITRGYNFPECELGRWSAGMLVHQKHFEPERTSETVELDGVRFELTADETVHYEAFLVDQGAAVTAGEVSEDVAKECALRGLGKIVYAGQGYELSNEQMVTFHPVFVRTIERYGEASVTHATLCGLMALGLIRRATAADDCAFIARMVEDGTLNEPAIQAAKDAPVDRSDFWVRQVPGSTMFTLCNGTEETTARGVLVVDLEPCGNCGGSGSITWPGGEPEACPHCNGHGARHAETGLTALLNLHAEGTGELARLLKFANDLNPAEVAVLVKVARLLKDA